jgi:hypothetical protein
LWLAVRYSSIHLTGRALPYVHPPDQPGAKKPPIKPKTINPTMTTAAAMTANTRREGLIFSPIEHKKGGGTRFSVMLLK